MEKQIIDCQYLISTYMNNLIRTSNEQFPVLKKNIHLLIIYDKSSCFNYRVKYGGKLPNFVNIPGYMIPLTMNYEIQIRQTVDHEMGCDLIDYKRNKELTINYVSNFMRYLNHPKLGKKIYDDALEFEFKETDYKWVFEGIFPVWVKGNSVTGLKLPDFTQAFIITGNCC